MKDEISDLEKVIKKCNSSRVTLDQLLTKQVHGNIVRALGEKGRRKEKISSKKVVFTKSNVSTSETSPETPSDSESKEVKGLKEQIQTHSETSLPTSQSGSSRSAKGKRLLKEISCEKEKHHRASFKTKRSFSISKCLHLLHMDLFRPVKPQSISHNKYTLVIVDKYSRSITVKRHGKKAYDVFRGRSPYISYFHVFGCHVHIHDHRDHLGKFDEKSNDGFFLVYSPVAKAFRVFNIRRQKMEETYHVTFSEDDDAISQSSTEGDAINFNENRSFPDGEFLEPRKKITQRSGNNTHLPYIPAYAPFSSNNINIPECPTSYVSHCAQYSVTPDEQTKHSQADDLQVLNEPDNHESSGILEPVEVQISIINEQISEVVPSSSITSQSINLPAPQDRWSRKKHIKLVNIISEPLDSITTRSRVKDSEAASAQEWFRQEEGIDYDETFSPIARLEAISIFLAYAAYIGFMVYQMDVKSEFLNDKALYGLKQAPRAWYQDNPKQSHLGVVKRIFRYLKGTPNLGLWYPKGSGFDLKAYSDSDYAGCNLDRKSTSGCCQILGGNQLADYDVLYDKVPIFCDNTSVIAISNNLVLQSRTKHINIRYHFIRDHILKGDIKLHFVPTELQLADIFTKPLAEPSFTRLVAELGILNIKSDVSNKKKALNDPMN
ncbi:retrovirus-related pol polyprotein from transposon TNT 1-94 [Tanacetum coccineum]